MPSPSNLLLPFTILGLAFGAEVPRAILTLRQNLTVGLTAGPSFAPMRCDQQGNLYVRMVDQEHRLISPVSKISSAGKVIATYSFADLKLPGEMMGVNDFAVSADGDFSAVASTAAGTYLVKFLPNGKVESSTTLSVGKKLTVTTMATLDNGEVLVVGSKLQGEHREPITFLLDRSGSFLKYVDTKEAFNVDEDGNVSDGDLRDVSLSQITSDGRRIYVMRPSDPARILAFNANGELAKTYKISAPEKGYIPLGIYASGGRIAIPYLEFREETVAGQVVRRMGPKSITRIVDQQSGTILIDYVAPPGVNGAFDCYVAPTQFLMLNGGDDGRFKLVTLSE